MGALIVHYFMSWVSQPRHGGPKWVQDHVHAYINLAGAHLGVPKAVTALLSGEMSDTTVLAGAIHPLAQAAVEQVLTRSWRRDLFETWGSLWAMFPKGGNRIWGSSSDLEHCHATAATATTNGEPSNNTNASRSTDMCLDADQPSMSEPTTPSNDSWTLVEDEINGALNDSPMNDHAKWTDPFCAASLPEKNEDSNDHVSAAGYMFGSQRGVLSPLLAIADHRTLQMIDEWKHYSSAQTEHQGNKRKVFWANLWDQARKSIESNQTCPANTLDDTEEGDSLSVPCKATTNQEEEEDMEHHAALRFLANQDLSLTAVMDHVQNRGRRDGLRNTQLFSLYNGAQEERDGLTDPSTKRTRNQEQKQQRQWLEDASSAAWHDATQTPLPNAPDLNIYCLYGIGKPTERAYYYKLNDETKNYLEEFDSKNNNAGPPPSLILDTSVNFPQHNVHYGVQYTNGDGSVPLLSLGYVCADAWTRHERRRRAGGVDLNPGRAKVYTREYPHSEAGVNASSLLDDPLQRSGPQSGEHVDFLGNVDMTEDVIRIVTDFQVDRVQENQIHSNIREIAQRIYNRFENPKTKHKRPRRKPSKRHNNKAKNT